MMRLYDKVGRELIVHCVVEPKIGDKLQFDDVGLNDGFSLLAKIMEFSGTTEATGTKIENFPKPTSAKPLQPSA
jgi:hypothetical protein